MVTMTQLPVRHQWTRHEHDAISPDGNRHELIDGVLIVSPAPKPVHQRVSFRLGLLLEASRPQGLEVLAAPVDVVLDDQSVVQPDSVVVTSDSVGRAHLDGAPLLAIEILSPSSRMIDLHVKKDRMRRAGCPHYWVVDPDVPSVAAWDLDADGEEPTYLLAGRAVGAQALRLNAPFDIEIIPSQLV